MDQVELARKIETVEAEQAEALNLKQTSLQKANEAEAMVQRQMGYLIALREIALLLQAPVGENGEVAAPAEPETEVLT